MTRWRDFIDRVRRPSGEAGVSLVEALVAMVIFVTLIAVMTSAVAAMTANMRQAEGVSLATDQVRLAFQRLDKQVRYANAINAPGEGDDGMGGWYVELSLEDPDEARYGVGHGNNNKHGFCVQWRVKAERLETRTWRVNPGGNPVDTTSWTAVATGITYERAFDLVPADPLVAAHQGLKVDLRVQRSRKPIGRSQISATFFARNTSLVGTPSPKCGQKARSG